MIKPRYQGFLSYSHASDARLADSLHQSLSRIARPWYRLRSMRIFLDKTNLSANPALWPTIEEALGESQYFLLLASPASAQSAWVQQEVGWWLKNRSVEKLVLCLTAGTILWDAKTGDFDWSKTDALPQNLKAAYAAEPLYADFREAKAAGRLRDSDPVYRDPLLDVAAPLMGRSKDDLDGEDIRTRRRTEGIAWASGLMIAVLIAVAALALGAARERQKIAASRALASASSSLSNDWPLALLLSVESGRIADTVEAKRSLLIALEHAQNAKAFLWGHSDAVTKAVFSPDGQSILSAGWDDRIVLWSVATHRQIAPPMAGPKGLVGVAFSPDGTRFASSSSGSIVLWDTQSRRPIGPPFRAQEDFTHVAFSSRGKLLAASTEAYGGHPSTVYLWDIAAHRPVIDPIQGSTFAFSPDDSMLAVAQWGDLLLYDIATHRALHKPLRGHTKNISSLAFSPDGSIVATGSEDTSIILWDVRSQKSVGALKGHAQTVTSLLFAQDGARLLSGSRDGTILAWDLEDQSLSATLNRASGASISDLFLTPEDELIALALDKERVILLRVNGDPPLGRRIKAPGSDSANVAFSPDGRWFASAGEFGNVVLWDAASGEPSGAPLEGHARAVSSLAFAPDGKTLVSGSEDGSVIFWDIPTRSALAPPFQALRSPVWSLACSPDGATVVAGGDAQLTFWDLRTRKQVGPPILSQKDRIWALAFSPRGDLLASVGNSLMISIWKSGQRDRPFQSVGTPPPDDSFELMPAGAGFSADGAILAASSPAHTVSLWTVKNWKPVPPVLYGHTQAVSSVAFKPDGSLLVSGGADGDIRLWDPHTHGLIGALSVAPEAVHAIAFQPGKGTLASVGDKGSIVLWDVDFADWNARACQIANRDLTAKEWGTYLGSGPYRKTCSQP